MVRVCVIALVGLPASGKTTFCKAILDSPITFNFIHVCYDEMFTFLPQSTEVAYKEERRKVLEKISQIIDSIKSNQDPIESVPSVIICDDNNYYAGMRYEIYKMCRKWQLSFGQIYFPVDLESALSRNCLRGLSSLPNSVIEQMSSRLEEPSKKNQWERNTLIIRDSFKLDELQSFLGMCLDNPLMSTCRDEELDSKSHSVVHEIDILLRKRIKELLQTVEGDLSSRAKVLNERRKSILVHARMRGISKENLNVDGILQLLLSD